MGDTYHFAPIGSTPLFVQPKDKTSLYSITAPLWQDFQMFELTQIMLQAEELGCAALLARFRKIKQTTDDMNILRTRVGVPLVKDAPFVAWSNKTVDECNEHAFALCPGDPAEIVAQDTIANNPENLGLTFQEYYLNFGSSGTKE